MTSAPKVGIIVLNYNGGRRLLSCLSSLEQLDYPNKDVIIVDNGSGDDSCASAAKQFPQFAFVRNGKNEGFAKGMNIGTRLALERGARLIWLFNNDAETDRRTLSLLIAAAEAHPQAGLLSPVIYETESGDIWFAKGTIEYSRMRALHILPAKRELLSKAYPSGFLTGCALLITKELIETIGFLDERFFLYYEDADYSLRALAAGFLCLVVPEARVSHSEESRSNLEKTYFLVHSGLLFFEKHAPLLLRPYLQAYVTIRRIKNVVDRLRGKGGAALEAYRAYQDYFHGR
ncbi:MAG: glycosyltransferase family 2 protein [Candidatus Moraniibacteriota bacterium]